MKFFVLLLLLATVKCVLVRYDVYKASAHFAVRLLKESGPGNKNAFFSPISISIVMAMLKEGAKGQTKQEISEVAFGALPDVVVKDAVKYLSNQLKQLPAGSYQLNLANRAYVSQNTRLLENYQQTLISDYNSDIVKMNFRDTTLARKKINDWASEQTKEKIKNVIPEGFFTGDEILVLVNAIYFKSDWQHQFKKEKTKDKEFTKLDNSKVNLPMMTENFRNDTFYRVYDEVTVLGLPYKEEAIVMYIILPKQKGGLDDIESTLTGPQLFDWIRNTNKRNETAPLTVSIPKFKMEVEMKLGKVLKTLGMVSMFTSADLSGINGDRSLYVSGALHKAVVEVNEEGSEAAAVTVVSTSSRSSAGRPRPFIADHPFLFAIVHQETTSILFLGRFAGEN